MGLFFGLFFGLFLGLFCMGLFFCTLLCFFGLFCIGLFCMGLFCTDTKISYLHFFCFFITPYRIDTNSKKKFLPGVNILHLVLIMKRSAKNRTISLLRLVQSPQRLTQSGYHNAMRAR